MVRLIMRIVALKGKVCREVLIAYRLNQSSHWLKHEKLPLLLFLQNKFYVGNNMTPVTG